MAAASGVRYGILGGAQLAIGAAAIFARFALTGAQPLAVAAARMVLAAAVLWMICAYGWLRLRSAVLPSAQDDKSAVLRHTHDDVTRSLHRYIFLAAGVALAIHFASWIWSLEYTSVAISTLLVSTTPIWTALYETAAGKQRLSRTAWGALAAGVAGLALVAGFNATRPPIGGHALLGGALALTGAIAIGAYFMLVREVRATYRTREIVTRTYTWAAIALALASAAARQAPPSLHAQQAWGGILAMALISQLLGHTAMNAALRWFTASAVALSTLLEPVIAGFLALLIFGERLTPAALTGGVLILIAIGIFLREESPGSVV